MTEREMKQFLEKMDEHELEKQRRMRKKKARFFSGIFVFVFVLGIIMVYLTR